MHIDGLRNPWRCSFDMADGSTLIAATCSRTATRKSKIAQGDNLGWRRMEADHCFDYTKPDDHPAECDKTGLKEPILEYNNCTAKPDGCLGISVTGGYVYRGSHAAWDGKLHLRRLVEVVRRA